MSHPFVTNELARMHVAELLAEAEQARTLRHTSPRSLTPASLWRRRRGRAGPAPTLALVGDAPATVRPSRTATGGNRAA